MKTIMIPIRFLQLRLSFSYVLQYIYEKNTSKVVRLLEKEDI